MSLQRESARPMYVQLKEAIAADIKAGHYQPHQRLTSERELCERYGVSRMTVRQALVELVREGVIYTRIGKGTFVSAPPTSAQLPAAVNSFSQEVLARGCRLSSRVLEAMVMPALPQVAHVLHIALEADVILLVCVRLSDAKPLALETTFLPFARFPDLLRHDFSVESLHHVLEHVYQLKLVQVEQPIEAALADAREADALGLRLPAAVLKMRRVTQCQDGLPIAFVLSTYCGDYYKQLSSASAAQP
ncbi:MAG TPA: GntR family transcriptional regulator [Roseiflexaceae bacterium]|nr:GntR family transcriptional regulator [Roseiflexaceae bacterium]